MAIWSTASRASIEVLGDLFGEEVLQRSLDQRAAVVRAGHDDGLYKPRSHRRICLARAGALTLP